MSAPKARTLEAGRPWPMGACHDGRGVNFAIFSAHAKRVELCLSGADGVVSLPLPLCTDGVWHGHLPGGRPGLRYAFRVFGPEAAGERFDPSRLLLDPCARRYDGDFSWSAADDRNSTYGLWSVVVDGFDGESRSFDWRGDRPPEVPWADTLLYEIHVRGATMRHPEVSPAERGTYGGLASPAMLAHYRRLGVTALNLLPVQQHIDEERLAKQGLTNYWGYNPIGFFVPEPRYARGGPGSALAEFRAMVRTLHAAGIEVILDVVFNHTAETDHTGPTLSWRGIDNRSYYRLTPLGLRYEDYSGCGNTFNLSHSAALRQVMDALRYWVLDNHVDGFRFDLAATLVRDSAFLAAVAQDPVLSRVKLIAEPWDLGPSGYRLGSFPAGWGEWNDRCRDTLQGYWTNRVFGAGALAQRLAGSSDAFRHDGRAPQASINYIAAHDGFTLRDLLSYEDKHNEANREDNRDGSPANFSIHCGVEGDTTDALVLERRRRISRALLATLFVTQGVPMLQAGDELGRTQAGNNNAYCQDSPLTWIDWPAADAELADFVAGLAALRRRHGALRRRNWLTGEPGADGRIDCRWLHPDGGEMSTADWHASDLDAFGMWIAGVPGDGEAEDEGAPADLLCIFNRAERHGAFSLPELSVSPAQGWTLICDSAAGAPFAAQSLAGVVELPAQAVWVLESKA